METSMRSVAEAQYDYAQNLIDDFLYTQSVLTEGAETFLLAMDSQLKDDNIIVPFLNQLQNNLKEAPQLISTYSPSKIRDFIMNEYQNYFLRDLRRSTSTWQMQLRLADLKILYLFTNLRFLFRNSKPQTTCWNNYEKSSTEIHSGAIKNYIESVEDIANGVHQRIDPVRNQIQQEITRIAEFFYSAALFGLPPLTQYVSKFTTD